MSLKAVALIAAILPALVSGPAVAQGAQESAPAQGTPRVPGAQGQGSDEGQVKLGLLDCAIKSGDDGLLQSAKDLSCTFDRGADQPPDVYFGQIRRVGLDLGKTEGGVIRWFVFAKTDEVGAGALAGDYVGVSAEATLGVGIGANALVSQGDQTIVLQPVSLNSQVGINLAAGITELELRSLN
ncbi:DUF992 domain-containing protein [Breoghania sp. JC706]|uniref:DUF992 domain-containing protein n=1 Tax=Breoghania sp. JC706 TaxID=3117732 RepID=UPI00300A27BB